ncbi:hypothetical protein GCM10027446_21400 [Angustibacter peucedani]
MSLTIHLLGRPHVERPDGDGYQLRSRKSWALLTYLLLGERAPSRAQLAGLLLAEADDPLRTLRWHLSELRRGLGAGVEVEGDPVVLRLPVDARVDVRTVLGGQWQDAVDLPGLGAGLLEGTVVRGAAGFETWLLAQQQQVAAATEAVLHEAALRCASRGDLDAALGFAVRAAAMNDLDETHQALLIRVYRLRGDDEAAARQYRACVARFGDELGVRPGQAVQAALREAPHEAGTVTDETTLAAVVEAGTAAVQAGAAEAGIGSLRTGVEMADRSDHARWRVAARLQLAEALVHSVRGLDEEGVAILHEADEIAVAQGQVQDAAQARAELGYVDFLRARYDRAQRWLAEALDAGGLVEARAATYLGCVASDRAAYPQAVEHLARGTSAARAGGQDRLHAYGTSMLGRVHLLRGELDRAEQQLTAAVELAEAAHWLAFLPWPQALLGEVHLARGDAAAAGLVLGHAFARACQLADPCWEGLSARGLALVAEEGGDTDRAFAVLADARQRAGRVSDPYVWLDAYILDAQCLLGRRHGHPRTATWVEDLRVLAARTGMKELVVRALVHGAALGRAGDLETAQLLAAEVDNPELAALVAVAGLPGQDEGPAPVRERALDVRAVRAVSRPRPPG